MLRQPFDSFTRRQRASLSVVCWKRSLATDRKRKKKLKISTVRSKQRRLLLTNQIEKADAFSKETMDHLVDRAQSRVSFLRGKIYEFWNPDLLKQTTQSERPVRVETVMDARWWLWNILFAISPAALFGFYCEFFGQHSMREYYRAQEIQRMKQTMGEDFVEENRNTLVPPPPRSFSQRVKDTLSDIPPMFRSFQENEVTEQADEQDNIESGNAKTILASDEKSGVEGSSGQSQPNSEKTIEGLLKRIQELEEHVSGKEKLYRPTEKYQEQRSRQSGIQNRMEDQKIAKWRDQVATTKDRNDQSQSEDKNGTSLSSLSTEPCLWVEEVLSYFHGLLPKGEDVSSETSTSDVGKNISPAEESLALSSGGPTPLVDSPKGDGDSHEDCVTDSEVNVTNQKRWWRRLFRM